MPTATAIPTQTPLAPTVTPTQMPPTPEPAGHQHGGATTQADIQLFQFKPDPIEIAAGTTVVLTNHDDIEHSVTHGVPPTPGDTFDSGLFPRGESFSSAFDRAGEYPYFCTGHTSMQGLVRVTP
jgi:plastocyanin